jgi:hypothetical protein
MTIPKIKDGPERSGDAVPGSILTVRLRRVLQSLLNNTFFIDSKRYS